MVQAVEGWQLNTEDTIEVLTLSLKKLNLLSAITGSSAQQKGRKLTPFATRLAVWKYKVYKVCMASTLTSRPAKQRLSLKPKIQIGLDYHDVAVPIIQRNRMFIESNWYIATEPYKALYSKYISENPDFKVSYGTFLALKPFYMRSVTTKDVEMCCCKKHLHARWAVHALVQLCKQQKLETSFDDYYSFFETISSSCGRDATTKVSWNCVVNKKTLCNHASQNWNQIKEDLSQKCDSTKTVRMQHFVKVKSTTKKGKEVTKLVASATDGNMLFILDFIDQLLAKMIHHRNHLHHYRYAIHKMRENVDAVFLDVDFSENLSIPVKNEPQSLHWSHEQVTIHSGIVKLPTGHKSYHPYVSDDRKHDRHFAQISIEKMLEVPEVQAFQMPNILVESDNCSGQYKSSAHFHGMQKLANQYNVPVIRIYGIAEHGKGEVDHVGGIAKTTIRREVAKGGSFFLAKDIVEHLRFKYGDNDPKYYIKEIDCSELELIRQEARFVEFQSVSIISNIGYCDILAFVEETGMSSL